MSFSAPAVVDDFNRADGAAGANYDRLSIISANQLTVISNQVGGTTTFRTLVYTPTTYGPDLKVAIKVPTIGNSSKGILYRLRDYTNDALCTGYMLAYSTSDGAFRLDKLVPTTGFTTIATFTATAASADEWAVEVIGSNHNLWRKASGGSWTLVHTFTDSTYVQSGKVGLYCGGTTTCRFDDLAAETIAPTENIKIKVAGSFVGKLKKIRVGGSFINPAITAFAGSGSFNGFADGLPGSWWAPYATSSPFNQALPGSPTVHPQSATLMANFFAKIGATKPGNLSTDQDDAHDYSHPGFFGRDTDPLYEIVTSPTNDLDGDLIPVPAGAQAAGGSDGHFWIVTPDGWEYACYQADVDHTLHKINCQNVYKQRYDGDGIVTPALIAANPGQGIGGVTASYFGQHAGIIRGPELLAAQTDPATAINHALFVVGLVLSNDTGYGFGTVAPNANGRGGAGSSVYPAFKGDAIPSPDVDLPPMGARLFLDMTASEINALSASNWEKAILHALRRFGGYFGDTGGPGLAFMFESGRSYTDLGRTNPFVTLATALGLSHDPAFGYTFVFHNGTPWTTKLKLTTS